MKALPLRNVKVTDAEGPGNSEVRRRYSPSFHFPPALGSAKKSRRESRPVRPPNTGVGLAADQLGVRE